jgi:acyl transferase domain-containing protein
VSLSPVKQAFLAVEQMAARIAATEQAAREPIAIIGMGLRLPGGAHDAATYWQLLRDGVDAITEVPTNRWDVDAYYDPDPATPGKMVTRWGGFVDDVDRFDPQVFGIAPREAVSMDPQQRLLLEVTWEALENAGIAPDSLSGSRTGVFVAISTNDYAQLQLAAGGLTSVDAYYATGVAHSIASGRLSYVLGLQGPSLSLDTACSSSLVGVHLAVQSLRGGETNLALAGGVNLILAPDVGVTLSRYHMLAPDGRCKPFDARADGFVRAEGCGVVVLKRLSDAQAHGDRILAVIRGSAVNQDGPSSGLTAPNGPAQEAVIRAALKNAAVEPGEVSYVEAHGTGTALGDPIEVQALGAALGDGRRGDDPITIGSVKANLGHLEMVAGLAGLAKVVLMLQHRQIPPQVHLESANPLIDWNRLAVQVPRALAPWNPRGATRIAGVSSFGFSGTNAHVVLEEAPAAAPVTTAAEVGPRLITLAARTPEALTTLARQYADWLTTEPADLAAVARTTQLGRAHQAERVALVAGSVPELRTQLAGLAEGGMLPAGVQRGRAPAGDPPRAAFLFTGQGAQYAGMGRGLYAAEPVFRAALDECAALLASDLDRPLLDLLAGPDAAVLDQTAVTQPALFALEYALARLWQSWGVHPTVVMGHSVGELVAACIAGVFSLADGLRLVAARGRLMGGLPAGGGMLAVRAPLERVLQASAPYAATVAVGAYNGPTHVVLSGARDALRAISGELSAEAIRCDELRVSHAFHSPLVEPMLDEFGRVAEQIEFHSPEIRIISNVTGAAAGAEVATAAYWRTHARAPVQFAAGARALASAGATLLVEIGPHPVLLGLVEQSTESATEAGLVSIPTLRRGRDELATVREGLGRLWSNGGSVDWAAVSPTPSPPVALPTYPFARDRYWFAAPTPTQDRSSLPDTRARAATTHPLLGGRLRSALREVQFETTLGQVDLSYLADHQVFGRAILPGAAFLDLLLAAGRAVLSEGELSLDDVVIHAPLAVSAADSRTVQVVVTPNGERAEVRIFSTGARDGSDAAWTLHCTSGVSCRPTAAATQATTLLPLSDIRARCASRRTADEHYGILEEHGLELGPSLRRVSEIWRRDGEALGALLPDLGEPAAHPYLLHPALLDAALQVVGAAMPSGPETFLPVGLDRLRCHRPATAAAWSHVVVRPVDRTGAEPGDASETRLADVVLSDSVGGIIAELRGLRFRRAHQPAASPDDWVYRVAWEPSPATPRVVPNAPDLPPLANLALNSASIGVEVEPHRAALAQLETLSTIFIAQALTRLGWQPRGGERCTRHGLATELHVQPRFEPLLGRWLDILVEDGYLERDADVWQVRHWPATGELSERRAAAEAWLDDHGAAFAAELRIVERCGASLADALMGRCDPLELLFPAGQTGDAEALYATSPIAQAYNARVAETVAGIAAAQRDGRRLRVLEIGAGTGGTTSFVVSRLAGQAVDYVFTDVSPLLLARAREKFSDVPNMQFQLLDVDADPIAQGFAAGSFDVVIATNVLHATQDVRATLQRVRALLARGGYSVIVETVQRLRWVDLSFGLTSGWWHFTDHALRSDYPLLDEATWLEVVQETGFTQPLSLGAGSAGSDQQVLLVSQVAPAALGGWLVVAAEEGLAVAEALAARLRQRGCPAITADAESVAFTERVRHLRAQGHSLAHVVHLGWLDQTNGIPDTAGELSRDIERALSGALVLAQQMIDQDTGPTPRLAFVTRGGQVVEVGDVPSIAQASVWGLANSIALEHSDLDVRRIDLSPAASLDVDELVTALLDESEEDQVALRPSGRYVARLERYPVAPAEPTPVAPHHLVARTRGTLDDLAMVPRERRAPGPGEVEIRVQATALNFKDVLNALDLYPGDPGPLGGECAGTIVACGEGVADLRVGDPVVAVAPGAFGDYVTTMATLVAAAPPDLTPEVAAALPIPFVTATFALEHLARLQPGERVLIHAAAGGVGLAAVQIAQGVGAEVFATAGSGAKRSYLQSLGIQHVYDSRSTEFADEILRATQNEGVDVVLNSLAGESIAASVRALRAGGRFLELGKRDLLATAEISTIERGITYFLIDWGATALARPALVQSIFRDVLARQRSGVLRPLPVTVFPRTAISDAFRTMAQARHTGKLVVSWTPTESPIRGDETYVVTGGLTGIGLLTLDWLVGQGARHVAVLARRPAGSAAQAVLDRLAAADARVEVVAGDVTRAEDVTRLFALIEAELPPVGGIFHAAGVLDDAALTQQNWERFARVLAPKVLGAWQLHAATQAHPVRFFVLYSSIAALFGSAGQANHAAANAALDALAHARRAGGRPVLSIDWGAWAEAGAAVEHGVGQRLARQGIGTLAPVPTFELLGRLLQEAPTQLAVVPIDWRAYGREPGAAHPFLAAVRPGRAIPVRRPAPDSSSVSAASVPALLDRLAGATPAAQRGLVVSYVQECAARVLNLPTSQLDERVPLSELGLDSLMAVELRNLLRTGLPAETALPATLVFDYPTIERIADFLLVDILHLAVAEPPVATSIDATHNLDAIEELSDDEVDRLLSLHSAQR